MCDIKKDELGPLKVLHLHSSKAGLDAVVVVDNTALGPAVGGVRVRLSVDTSEVQRLARTMTFKNSIAGLPHGGGKAGISMDPASQDKKKIFHAFAELISSLDEYIPGPDMGSDEECMAWIYEETGRTVGLPERLGGLPLDRLGATGFGVSECAEVASRYAGIGLEGARVAIHGFGSVGMAASKFMALKGSVIVAAADITGTVFDPSGLDLDGLIQAKAKTGSVAGYQGPGVRRLKPWEVLTVACDILIPAATADVININNVGLIKAKLVLQGANLPVTDEAEDALYKRGILSVPDFIANAGGVIMAAMEYAKKGKDEAFKTISRKIRENTELVLEKAKKENELPVKAATELALGRIKEEMEKAGL